MTTETFDPSAPNAYYRPVTEVELTLNHEAERPFGEYKLRIAHGSHGQAVAVSAHDAQFIADTINATLQAPPETPSLQTELEQLIDLMCRERWVRHQKLAGIEDPAPFELCPAMTKFTLREFALPLATVAYNFLGKRGKR